jgi:GNAT superfamily N-acetyltransferase
MADAEIVIVGTAELPLVVDLYNEIARPPRDLACFQRRVAGRQSVLILIANVERRPVAFSIGIELKPDTFFSWLTGVVPECRRQGIATQLHEAEAAWAKDHGYQYLRMECSNTHRPLMMMGLKMGFDVVGLRWDPERSQNLVIMEKDLSEAS